MSEDNMVCWVIRYDFSDYGRFANVSVRQRPVH